MSLLSIVRAGFAYTFIQPDEADRAQDATIVSEAVVFFAWLAIAVQDLVDALRQCNQEVPLKLKALAEDLLADSCSQGSLVGSEIQVASVAVNGNARSIRLR